MRIFKTHLLFFIILSLATVLRFYHIRTDMIFVGDQGRDALVAKAMSEGKTFPLLGIPSSIPRFKQGPLYIYLLAVTYSLTNGSLLATGVLSALMGIAAVIAIYLLVYSYTDKQSAVIAAGLFAFLPMLLLHSRMPYHINPIPLAVILYLWQLLRLYEGKPWSAFGAAFSFALVFQFELAAFPLLVLIPFILLLRNMPLINEGGFRIRLLRAFTGMTRRGELSKIVGGLTLGLLPQIIYDVTHGFSQLGGFLLWVGYKLASALLPFTDHSLADRETPAKFGELLKLFLSIFTQTAVPSDQIVWLLVILGSCVFCLISWRRLNVLSRLSLCGFLLLSMSFLIHRVPSEAYMPLIAPFAILMIGTAISFLQPRFQVVLLGLLLISLAFSSKTLLSSHFFLLESGESRWEVKRFGPSIRTQQHIVQELFRLSKGRCIVLESKEREQSFPTLYNHLEYVLSLDERQESRADCVKILIDKPQVAKELWEDSSEAINLGAYWALPLESDILYAKT